jgi:putative ABC transport system substrate-binding protein
MAATPMVFTTAFDPVEAGIVTSLSRPDGNVTGVSFFGRALGPKRLELLRELLPKATTVAFLHNPKYPVRPVELAGLQRAASTLGLQLNIVSAGTVAEIDQVFMQLGQQRPDGLLLNPDLLFLSQRDLLVALAARHRIPAFYPMEEYTRAGGLISYGASTTAAYRQAGNYVGRILKGAKPAELPVSLPTKFNVTINLKTAKALGLTVSDSFVLFRADEVIE